jgi:hypothetical protein
VFCKRFLLWDMYAAMLDQHKPVELQHMRGGEHNIRKALQVFARGSRQSGAVRALAKAS